MYRILEKGINYVQAIISEKQNEKKLKVTKTQVITLNNNSNNLECPPKTVNSTSIC